jgi:hypothetical protein
MLTFHQNTAVCDIVSTQFVTKKGKPCACSELFFIDGTSLKYYDFGKLARQYQQFVFNHRSKSPIIRVELDKIKKEEYVNGIDE